MSSLYAATDIASNAVDGVYLPEGDVYSLVHSLQQDNPWWRVDLGAVHCIWAIEVLNRGKLLVTTGEKTLIYSMQT